MQAGWLLNLDAELELQSPHNYVTRRRVATQVQARLADLGLLTQGEPVVGQTLLDPGHIVYCWCPTPSATRGLERLGLAPVRGPELEVLRAANHRTLVSKLSPQLRRCFVTADDDWQRRLFDDVSPSGAWRLKRCFGFAGRGQRRVRGSPSADDLRWVRDSLRQGGLLREVELDILGEFSVHGYIDRQQLLLGRVVSFESDRFGSPGHFRLLADAPHGRSDDQVEQALRTAAESVAERLLALDYFGPFGVDGFMGSDGSECCLNAVSDVNARFTLAWSLGMGPDRHCALESYLRRGL